MKEQNNARILLWLVFFLVLAISSIDAKAQTKKHAVKIIFGQEMSKIKVDDKYKQFSIVEPNGYQIKGINMGDTIYHNNLVTIDAAGYPMDLNYEFKKIRSRPRAYKVVAVQDGGDKWIHYNDE